MKGWYGQSHRHYLAAKGIRTNYYSVPLRDAKFITLYHGTTKKNAEKILKEGLKPYKGSVHLTPSKSAAIMHAEVGPEKDRSMEDFTWVHSVPDEDRNKENAVVLKVTIPKEDLKDEYSPVGLKPLPSDKNEWSNLDRWYEVEYKKPVSPEKIEKVDIGELKKVALRRANYPAAVGKNYNVETRRSHRKGEGALEWVN